LFFLFLFTYGAAKLSNKFLSFYSFSTKKGKNAKKSRQLAPSALAKKLYEKKIYFLFFSLTELTRLLSNPFRMFSDAFG